MLETLAGATVNCAERSSTHRPDGGSGIYDFWVGEYPLAVLDNICRVDARGFPVADAWFSVRQVADGITLVTEPHVDSLIRANFYHVHGSDADLIVDTGTGIAPLAWVPGGLIDATKQVIAVATHTHYDHVGGMHEFGERLVIHVSKNPWPGKASSPASSCKTFLCPGDLM